MTPATGCQECAATQGVRSVVAKVGGRERELRLCPGCKAEHLERRRVRTGGAGRANPRSSAGRIIRTVGRVFIATGAAILLVLAASAIVRITDRTPGTECYPGAGFNCDAPIKR